MFKTHPIHPESTWHRKVHHSLIYGGLHHFFMAMIVMYAIFLGISLSTTWLQPQLNQWLDNGFMILLGMELGIKLLIAPREFHKHKWNFIDVCIFIGAFFMPAIKILRLLRFFVYMNTFVDHPLSNRVVHTFVRSLPTLITSSVVLFLVVLSYGLLTTSMFGQQFPNLFGSIGKSLYTLFQLMTLDGWTDDIGNPLMTVYPWAWVILISFILLTAYGLTNIFVGAIVSAMSFIENSSEDDGPSNKELYAEIQELKKIIIKQHAQEKKTSVRKKSSAIKED